MIPPGHPAAARARRRSARGAAFSALVALSLALGSVLVLGPRPALAVEASEMLADPALEARARALSAGFRCLVCQNESIDESNAPLAHDLRVLIREQLSAGRSEAEIRDFLVARYGQLVLLRPRLEGETLLLWFGPFLVLAIGAVLIGVSARRRSGATDAPLSAEERARLARLGAELEKAGESG
jgi:cytochrome c-type biogenesis protein CcmH